MPIALPGGLPAAATLRAEGIEVASYTPAGGPGNGPAQATVNGMVKGMANGTANGTANGSANGAINGSGARCKERRTLRVALVNLMPEKQVTETQIARRLGAGAFTVHLTLILPDGYRPRTAPKAHLESYYRCWSEVREEAFDGLVVTGAPVEHLAFEAVDYWRCLQEIIDWSHRGKLPSLFICWAAQAALYHLHGVPKRCLAQKAFGVYDQRVEHRDAPVLRGIGTGFPVPVSRHSEVSERDLPGDGRIRVLARSNESGLCLLEDRRTGACFMFNHLEYDAGTLGQEYRRDLKRGAAVGCPVGYYPGDDPTQAPVNSWQDYAQLFFQNWLNEVARHAAASAAAGGQGNAQLRSPWSRVMGNSGAEWRPWRQLRARFFGRNFAG